jgi:hypothetical protein
MTPADDGARPGTVARKLLYLCYGVLRIATIGYNVSFEKPVVVRHDQPSRSMRPILDR